MGFLTGQIAVVTGAGSGIGKAISLGLAEQGSIVYMLDKDKNSLNVAQEDGRQFKKRLIPYHIDLARDEAIQRIAIYLKEEHDAIDMLVHSAGVISFGDIGTASVDDFDWQFKINVRAPYLLTQVLLPMIRIKQGQVVFINSSVGLHAKAGSSGYSASKHALKALADSLRDEEKVNDVRVISVYPGRTATPMQAEIFQMEGKQYVPDNLLKPKDIADILIQIVKLRRTAEITDLNVRSANKWE